MSTGKTRPRKSEDLDEEVAKYLGNRGEGAEDETKGEDFDAVLRAVQERITEGERDPLWRLRSFPTAVRRLVALGVALVVGFLVLVLMRRPDWPLYPQWRMLITLLAAGVLLVLSLWHGLRPRHCPPLPTWVLILLASISVLATFTMAIMPAAHNAALGTLPDHLSLWNHATPCFLVGLSFGLPIFVLTRLLDRGSELGAVLAACAGGLMGNFVLQAHCPVTEPQHLMAGHFTVLVLFLAGLGVLRFLEQKFRQSR